MQNNTNTAPITGFGDLELSPGILKAIAEMGFETPSPIQAQALPVLLGKPTDFIGLAGTGTGKTGAFGIPLCERIAKQPMGQRPQVQALVLCPTRELALQVSGQLQLIGKHQGLRVQSVYGGSSFREQAYGLEQGAHVVVGTPGRLIDHMERGTLSLKGVKTIVLDEADEMISMGFKDELETILADAPDEGCNTWLFTATMSPEVRRVAGDYLYDPREVQINRGTDMLSAKVEQTYYATHESNKPEVLRKLIDAADDFYGLVFFQTKALVIDLTNYLRTNGYSVDCLHGDMEQDARDRVMRAFRERRVTVLLCTDVASRGLDVKDVTHVINYSLPRELDNYVHRIGRTARSGKSGQAMSLVTPSHRGLVRRIEQMTKSRMKEGVIPTRRDLARKKVAKTLSEFGQQEFHGRALEVMGEEWKAAVAGMNPEEIAARFLTMMYAEIFVDQPQSRIDQPRGDQSRGEQRPAHRVARVAPARPVTPMVVPVVVPVAAAPAVMPMAAPVVAPVVAATAEDAAPAKITVPFKVSQAAPEASKPKSMLALPAGLVAGDDSKKKKKKKYDDKKKRPFTGASGKKKAGPWGSPKAKSERKSSVAH